MQQTTTYKLNLIETDDVFSPEPLNQNARKVETALADGAAALAEETAARQKAVADEIAARQKAVSDEAAARKSAVTALERHKFACGTYTGNTETSGGSQTIQLGFTPTAVVLPALVSGSSIVAICLTDKPYNVIKIVPGGFTVYHLPNTTAIYNSSANRLNTQYTYLAFA